MAMNFETGALGDSLSEVAGHKSGLALSIAEMCDHLSGTEYPDIIIQSEKTGVRIRSEEFESLFFKLLHRIGYTAEEHTGVFGLIDLHKKYIKNGLQKEFELVEAIYQNLFKEDLKKGTVGPFDFTEVIIQSHTALGKIGYDIAMEYYEYLSALVNLNPYTMFRSHEWKSKLDLGKLFSGTKEDPEYGQYIDQRFVNYLAKNTEKIGEMHWRKFEELSAEYFYRNGYIVELGPGSNDDGVDIRVWKPGEKQLGNPLCLIQCKRVKSKVEKVIVKGLHSDVEFEGASYGVIVTSSELSTGARESIRARGYPIEEVNKEKLNIWLETLRTPGTGIIRSN